MQLQLQVALHLQTIPSAFDWTRPLHLYHDLLIFLLLTHHISSISNPLLILLSPLFFRISSPPLPSSPLFFPISSLYPQYAACYPQHDPSARKELLQPLCCRHSHHIQTVRITFMTPTSTHTPWFHGNDHPIHFFSYPKINIEFLCLKFDPLATRPPH